MRRIAQQMIGMGLTLSIRDGAMTKGMEYGYVGEDVSVWSLYCLAHYRNRPTTCQFGSSRVRAQAGAKTIHQE